MNVDPKKSKTAVGNHLQVNYLNRIARHKVDIRCLECGEWFQLSHFEKHVQKQHQVSKLSCPWCFGKYSFPARQKAHHMPHLDSCLNAYLKRFSLKRSRSTSPPPIPAPSPSIHSKSKRQRTPLYTPVYDAATLTTCSIQPSDFTAAASLDDVEPFICDRVHTLPDPFYLEYEPMYPERDMFGAKTFPDIGPGVFEMKFTLEGDMSYEWWQRESVQLDNCLTFRGNDNIGIYYVKMYLHMKEVLGFQFEMWHIYIRFPGYKSFENHLTEYGDGAFILPFACLCKGGGGTLKMGEYEVYRHHKHMILAARDMDHFKTHCWNRIRSAYNPPPGVQNYRCKGYKRIQNDLHLGFTIRYLGTPRSRCVFENEDVENSIEEEIEFVPLGLVEEEDLSKPISLPPQPKVSRPEKQMNHYFIQKSMSRHFMFALASQVKGMWTRLFNVLCGPRSVDYITEHCIEKPNGPGHTTYWVKIKYALGNNPLDMCVVLHVDKKWIPYKIDSTNSEAYMFLIGEERLHFKESKSAQNMLEIEWCWMQVARGNVFSQVIGESLWRPTKPQQTALSSSVQFAKHWRLSERMYQDKSEECHTIMKSIAEKDQMIAEQNKMIEEREKKISEQQKWIEERENKIMELKKCIETLDKNRIKLQTKAKREEKQNTEMNTVLMKQLESEIEQLHTEIKHLKTHMQRIIEEKIRERISSQRTEGESATDGRKKSRVNVNIVLP